MIDNSCVVLDGIKYQVVDKIKVETKEYVYLVNENDKNDICCRKEIEENGKTFLVGLDSDEEVNLTLKLFLEKHQNER
ncbi:hypothetical protein EGW03_01855 [bacterium]|jgi:hypothetical protein|nr:hypothetical protein [bacterium]